MPCEVNPHEPRWRFGLIGYVALLFVATHIPSPVPLEAAGISLDKLVHIGAYGLLAYLALRWWSSTGAAINNTTRLLIVATICAYGALDELTQPLVNRVCDLYDWVADTLGAGLVAAIHAWKHASASQPKA